MEKNCASSWLFAKTIGLNLYVVNNKVTSRNGAGEHPFVYRRLIGLENHMEENNHGIFQGMSKTRKWPSEPAHIHPISKGKLNSDTL